MPGCLHSPAASDVIVKATSNVNLRFGMIHLHLLFVKYEWLDDKGCAEVLYQRVN